MLSGFRAVDIILMAKYLLHALVAVNNRACG